MSKRIFVAVAALFLIAAMSDSGRWRAEVVALKLGGRLPGVGWGQVVSGLGLCGMAPCHRGLVRGEVTFDRIEPENPCPVVWNTPFGPMRGFFEDRRVLEHFLTKSWPVNPDSPRVRAGDVVLEIGAWLGAFTRFALDAGAKLVVAFEPVGGNRACFEQNFAEEIEQGRVVVISKAAWEHGGTVKMANIGPMNPEKSSKGFAVAEEGPMEAQTATIDETVESLGLESVDFINIDIEGGEESALRGAAGTLRRFRPVVVSCIHHRPEDRERVPRVISEIEPSYMFRATSLQGFFVPPPQIAR